MNIPICTCRACAIKLATLRDMVFDKWFMEHHPNVAHIYEETGMEVLEIARTIGIEDLYYTEMTVWSADQEYARERLEMIRERLELIRAFQAMIPPVDDDGDNDGEDELRRALEISNDESYKEYTSTPKQVNEFLNKRKSAVQTEYVCSICYENMTEYAYTLPCADASASASATAGATATCGICKAVFCEDCFRTYLLTPRTKEHYDCPYKCKNTFTLDTHPEHPEHSAHSAHSAHSVHSAHPEHPVHSAQQEDEVKPDSGLASAANS
jgi:hypothetical protein